MEYNVKQLNELLDDVMENETKDVDVNELVKNMILRSISEEQLAIADYDKRALECEKLGHEKMVAMFKELAEDERVHAAQLYESLKLLDLVDEETTEKGEEEAQEILEK